MPRNIQSWNVQIQSVLDGRLLATAIMAARDDGARIRTKSEALRVIMEHYLLLKGINPTEVRSIEDAVEILSFGDESAFFASRDVQPHTISRAIGEETDDELTTIYNIKRAEMEAHARREEGT